jgi:formate hydrogenlyase transcriptional activator
MHPKMESPMAGPQTNTDALHSVMASAALFEGEFTLDWLVELTGLKAHQCLVEIQEEHNRKAFQSPSPGIYIFKPSKNRAKWIETLKPAETENLRRRLVDILVRELPEDESKWKRISRHLLLLSNDLEGCRILSMAGDAYRKAFQTEQAFLCYTKALEDLVNLKGDEADRLFMETAIKYSKISTARHDTGRVLETLNLGLSKAQARDNLSYQALFEMHIAKNEWLRTNFDQALVHFDNGWALAKKLDDPQTTSAVTAFGTFFLYWQGRFREAVEGYERTADEVADYPKARFPLLGTITVGYCYAQIGQHTQGLGMLDAIRTRCLERGDVYLAAYASGNIGEIMLDMRRVDDALYYLENAARMASESHNRWVWMVAQVILAFAYYLKDERDQAVSHLSSFLEYSREAGATVHPYPYLSALAWAVHQGRLPGVNGLDVRSEMDRMLKSQNVYVRGLGWRYKAFLLREQGADAAEVMAAHEESLNWIAESGHQIELARSRLELARYLIDQGRKDQARKLTEEAAQTLSSLDQALVPDDLRYLLDREKGSESLLSEILDLGQELVRVRDNRDLAQRIISVGNRVTGAERGAIFLWEQNEDGQKQLILRASKNLTSDQVDHPYFASSLKMIREVANGGGGCIAGEETDEGASYVAEGVIRSKVCVPMTLHDEVVGVLYHDNRLLSSAFKESDLGLLSYFAALAAIALDNARAYEEIHRLNVRLSREKEYFEEEHLSHLHFDEIVGRSRAIKRVMAQIGQVAGTEANVLITGETGVGKELVARAIHRHGLRCDGAFIGVQLSTLPENLIASELMGHEKGAFTGAARRRTGRFELADGGTLFLDEIGDISPDLQVLLLRVLQTKEFERIGGTETIRSDFRLIAATNRDLETAVRQGGFRADLYYRLNVFPIYVPPLRERREDIPLLARHFLKIHSQKLSREVEYIPDEEMAKMLKYAWPGNVRELQNVIERGVILAPGHTFRMPEPGPGGEALNLSDQPDTLAQNEKRHILRVLEQTDWKVSGPGGTAEILDVPPSTLSFRMKKLGIKRPSGRKVPRRR